LLLSFQNIITFLTSPKYLLHKLILRFYLRSSNVVWKCTYLLLPNSKRFPVAFFISHIFARRVSIIIDLELMYSIWLQSLPVWWALLLAVIVVRYNTWNPPFFNLLLGTLYRITAMKPPHGDRKCGSFTPRVVKFCREPTLNVGILMPRISWWHPKLCKMY